VTAQTVTPHLAPHDALLRALASSPRALAPIVEELRTGAGVYAAHETIAAARPALLASLYRALERPLLVIVPTPDVAERAFADLLYYLAEDEPEQVALLRSRDEALGAIESPSERSARMTLLADLAAGKPRLVLAPVAALRQYLMPRALFERLLLTLRIGDEPGFEQLQERLFALGYERADVVSAVGEYAVRGGILDLFAASEDAPIRIEFFGEAIESMRPFDLASQRSEGERDAMTIAPWSEIPREAHYRARVLERYDGPGAVRSSLATYIESGSELPASWLPLAYDERTTLLDYLRDDTIVVLDEPGMLATIEDALEEERSREQSVLLAGVESGEFSVSDSEVDDALLAEIAAPHPRLVELAPKIRTHPVLIFPGAIERHDDMAWVPAANNAHVIDCRPVEHFNRQIELFSASVREWVAAGESLHIVSGAVSRTADLLRAAGIAHDRVVIDHGSIEAGFALPDLRLRVLGDREIFGAPPKRVKLRAVKEGVPVTLADLRVGDYVVHAVHGIGQYLGLRTETILGATQDYLNLAYAGSDRMLVPVTQMHQVARYSAAEGQSPRLSKMGGADWARTKSRVSESLAKIADGLVALYAERELSKGFEFGPDTPWQGEMEEAFPYEPTPDQRKAIEAVKLDMEKAQPMDRLVCGDVGYGKTEVAMRAAFKAVAEKKQVAVLVPTTLLADQHYRTFSARFAGFPLRIEELSRFKTKAEARAILADLALGKVDVIIGTHRLLQKDVAFADLTLSATPIPRTLHMSLMGVRDLSLIQTAPKNRMSVKTVVVPASDAIVQRAITAELDRGGQVYYLHNRVESIFAVRNALQRLVPRARIAVGHGQMHENELEPVMQSFIDGETDVLVATTIIENGIDIANVNTMIVGDADKFGLAQLYQLRGRVGRSNHQAYCYLLYQGHKALTEEAKARLEAIREFTHLGSGLQIAMRDLEIRGAGNLLGAAQSGFIGSVGFDTYCQMLADAIAERRGTPSLDDRREAVIDVKISAFIPSDYIPQVSQKIAVYQQLAKARSQIEVEEIAAGVRDRFGPLPVPLDRLVELTKLRAIALERHVTRVVVDERRLTLGVGTSFELDAAAIPKLQSLTKNRFRFGEGKIVVDLPAVPAGQASEAIWMPLLRKLLEAL
jgi:transcription-repair coupling factor (superfamily II helicase)